MSKFYCEPIDVKCKGVPKLPVSFKWCGKQHKIIAIEKSWRDWGFHRADPKRNWTTRRHRNYHHVKTKENRIFEIYLDCSNKAEPTWILNKEIT